MNTSIHDITAKDNVFKYQLLSRLQQDCDYFLGYGQRQIKHLWALDVEEQIKYMKALYHSFSDDEKPEWLSLEDILKYERLMLEN